MIERRKPNNTYITGVRSMEKADIESLRQPSARMRIQKLRDSHHIIARLIVSGLSNAEVAAESGYSITRIAVLRNSPAMVELCAKYRDDDHTEWRQHRDATYEYMHRVRLKAIQKIEDAIDDDENPPKPDFLIKAFDSMADRTNYHRKSTKENINIDFAARLELAYEKSKLVLGQE